MHDKRQVMAIEPNKTLIYPSMTEVMDAYGIASTSQLVRLIDNEQNIPHTRIYLDWWDGLPVATVTDVTEDMMSDGHLRRMRSIGVKVIPTDAY